MSSTSNTSPQSINRRLAASAITLSLWCWRQQWVLLMMLCIGMIAAVTIVCAIPLLSSTMQTAGLRNVLRASPNSSEVAISAQVAGLSTQGIGQIYPPMNIPLQRHLKTFLNGPPRFDFRTPLSSILSPKPLESTDQLDIYGTSMNEAASHVLLIQGRLPHPTSNDTEVAVSPETAQVLKLHVGSKLVLNWTIYTGPADHSVTSSNIPKTIDLTFTMRVVGIFSVQSADPFFL